MTEPCELCHRYFGITGECQLKVEAEPSNRQACNAYPQLQAALRKLVDAARSREWDSENEYYADGGCRDCLSMSYKKHLKNCPYAAAIAEAERLLGDAT